MNTTRTGKDCFGFARPAIDAHTLGISSAKQLLDECGLKSISAGVNVCDALNKPDNDKNIDVIQEWIRGNGITVLGFSYRLDPEDGASLVGRLIYQLKNRRILAEQGGPIRGLFFAGLPGTCELVRRRNPEVTGTFSGDETPADTLRTLGIDPTIAPRSLTDGMSYDEARLAFGRELIRKGDYLGVKPVDRSGYKGYGTKRDTLVFRLNHGIKHRLPPLMRAHVGPYLSNRKEAVRLFIQWTKQLAASGFLDILSIGTSQLTQSHFGQAWKDMPNGGGVPLNSAEEFAAVWRAARPMLVRAYAGTANIPQVAGMYEETINIAWHALSFWWFSAIDGRGPYSVLKNLEQHFETLRYIARTGKPLEPNVPHHFAFRGCDDVTYVASAVIAAKAAKLAGVRCLVLQNMLNTPRQTWGIQDLAKSRAMLQLVGELEDDDFCVILQPRGGLDYFSSDLNKARAQLAAVTALMDDIEPHDSASPQIIHVVSYSEASHLADPGVVDESIKITRHALEQYRKLRKKGLVDDMTNNPEVMSRTKDLVTEVRSVIRAIESFFPFPYSVEGFYRMFAYGCLPVPYLWECRDEFTKAVSWQTCLLQGSVKVVDKDGIPIPVADRMRMTLNSILAKT